MSDKHTPGPWFKDTVNGSLPRYRVVAFSGDSKVDVLNVYEGMQPQDAASEANARLMASAPDLLAALSALVDLKEGPRDDAYRSRKEYAWDAARAALARARGSES